MRWGALLKPGGRKGWLREARRLLLVTALALPIVVPPALVVGAALVLFNLVECVIWVPLKAVEIVKRRTADGTPKEAVAPHLTWKL